jgi:hypothetical protein
MKRALKVTSSGVLASKTSSPSSETAPPALSLAAALLEGHFAASREAVHLF